jgi:glycosyltransferase involved in cell wall biosynthesis
MEPVPSAELAGELRQCDVYITASQNDPCSNALIEALSCGLPAIFLRSGGHPELVGLGGLGFDRAEEIPALLAEVSDHYAAFQASISVESIDDVATRYLACIGA